MLTDERLDLLRQMAHGVAAQFGPSCEVVIHDLSGEDLEHTVVHVENGHVTGRKPGDGPTHAVLDLLRSPAPADHLAYLTAICVLKRVMSTRDMDLLIREELQGDRPISDGYAAFCGSLNKALNAVADEMEDRTGEEELADAAIHFALMSYAAGVASSRYVTLLRQRQEAREEAASAAHAKSKERAKKEKEKD